MFDTTTADTPSSTNRRIRLSNTNIGKKPQRRTDKVPHMGRVASCSDGGRQTCIACLLAGYSTLSALLVCCLPPVVSGLPYIFCLNIPVVPTSAASFAFVDFKHHRGEVLFFCENRTGQLLRSRSVSRCNSIQSKQGRKIRRFLAIKSQSAKCWGRGEH